MKALVISSKYFPEYAGSGFRAHNTYLRLRAKYKIEFSVLSSSVTYNKNELYDYEGTSVYRISKKPLKTTHRNSFLGRLAGSVNYWIEFFFTFCFLLKNHKKFDYFHVFGNVTVTSASVTFAKIFKKPMVVEVVNLVKNPDQSESRIFKVLFGKGYPKQSKIVCISKQLEENCIAHGYKKEQIWCRDNPIDEKRFFYEKEKKLKFRAKVSSFGEGDIVLVHLAKFYPLKNQIFLLDVLKELPIQYKLILAGPKIEAGPLYERDALYFDGILSKVKEYGLENRVEIIAKFIENPEEYIKAADVFLFPSKREAFGTPVLEALACGVPCVTNDIPGVFDERITNGENGFYNFLDSKEWANLIEKASKIPEEVMKETAAKIRSKSTTEIIDEKYFEIISEMCQV